MQRPRIIILTALVLEASHIAGRFAQKTPTSEKNVQFEHNEYDIEMRVTGVGAIRLPEIAGDPPAAIIMAGLAGALDPELKIGDVIIDEASTWHAKTLPFPKRKIHTAQTLVASVGDKSSLFVKTGAAAVEMENAAVRKLAANWGTAYLGIRSISDKADQPLDPAVLKCINPFGGAKIEIVYRTLRRPALMAEFYRLFRDSNAALKTLSPAVESIFAS